MATLQNIRTRAGLLIAIVIGLALAAFILGDLLQSSSSILQRNQMELGEVNGESIQYPAFQQDVEELGQIYRNNTQQTQLDENAWVQVREQTWQNEVRKLIMQDVYDDLGIQVSSEELFDMIQGSNLHPIIQQLFTDQNTGMVNRSAIINFLKNLETGVSQENRDYWLYLENQIVDDRTQSKYSNMVGKGLYVTNIEAESGLAAKNKVVNFDYIALPINDVSDDEVQVTDSDLKAYYEEHKEDYKQEKLRSIEYINFPVTPSASDFTDAEKWVNDIKSDFESTTENVQFVNSNSDVAYDDTWYKKEELPENIGRWIFDEGAVVNAVFGPYFQNNQYILAKLNELEMMPDSVKARHILLQPASTNNQTDIDKTQALADSLKTVIENGGNFAALAEEFSMDQGSAILGGDVGWFGRGQMVKSFEEAAFNSAKNEISVVTSNFGFHVIQTTDRGELTKQARVAYLVRMVQSSTKTYQNVYAQASKFAGENNSGSDFEKAVTEQKLTKKVASVGENDLEIAGLENARPLIRAAYETNEGKIIISQQESPIFELGDNFVIAVVAKVTEAGIAPFEDVKERVELSVMKEKKADFLVKKATGAASGKTDLQAIAQELNKEVQSAANVSFNSFSIPNIGLEPAVIGYVTSLGVDKISEPVVGTGGVYIVKVTSVNELADQNLTAEKLRLVQDLNMRALSGAYNAHHEVAEITDKRSTFY